MYNGNEIIFRHLINSDNIWESLKIPKMYVKTVLRKRTDNIMTKGKVPNLQYTIRKAKDQTTHIPLKSDFEFICIEKVTSSCFTSGIRRINRVCPRLPSCVNNIVDDSEVSILDYTFRFIEQHA